jgi:nitroreductase
MSEPTVFDVIRSRRAVSSYSDAPVDDEAIRRFVEAARLASSASNRRIHRSLVVRQLAKVRLAKALSPGMLAAPPALIVICTDEAKARQAGVKLERDTTTWIDVGTAAMNMMLAAHALGLATCPVTSFSAAGLRVVLDLPEEIVPELLLMLGHPAPQANRRRSGRERIAVDDLIDWERIGGS